MEWNVMCMCVRVLLCRYVYMYVFIYICLYVYVYIYIFIYQNSTFMKTGKLVIFKVALRVFPHGKPGKRATLGGWSSYN
jgi:hypothetical protein